MTFGTRKRSNFHVILPANTSSLFREFEIPLARNQRPTTIDDKYIQRYQALSVAAGRLVSMAAMRRAAHNLYLDTLDIWQRVLAKYRRQGICLSEVELMRKLLCVEFYRDAVTIVNEHSNAG